ncbi:GGDEF domain-containing protein [Devosia sp.]|uniref:GGDEF domain-containing protein n=1 Tax=Devosia sp. TaxID=1871048 RepID=UPI003A92F2AB
MVSLAAVSVPAYVGFAAVVHATAETLGKLFAEKQILYDRYRGLNSLMQEVKLAETLASSDPISDWAKNEFDPVAKARGIAALEHFRDVFADHSYFFVIDKSANYYFNDADNSYAGRQLSHSLSADNPRDSWYYSTIKLDGGCHLNVDRDDVLSVTKVWINCVIREGDAVLGVLGTGLDLTAFVQDVVDVPQPGVTPMFVDRAGAIQAHRDRSMVDFHSITKADGSKKTVFSLLDRQADRDRLREMMTNVATKDVRVESQFMLSQGHEVLVGVGYLDQIGWFNVTVMDINTIIDRSVFIPIAILLAVVVALCVLVLGVIFKKQVLDRLARMEVNFKRLEAGVFEKGQVDTADDEIGRMSRSFAAMASAVSDHTRKLESAVAERTAELHALAYRDQLTEISNRRAFVDDFRRIAAEARINGSRLGLLLVDIDNFKSINDAFGHRVGDQVVVEVARRLQGVSRDTDLCARWGGDEFIVLINGTGSYRLRQIAETVLAAIAGHPVITNDGAEVRMTVSIGASIASPSESIDFAVELADAALYRAKAEGRNRVMVLDPEETPTVRKSA